MRDRKVVGDADGKKGGSETEALGKDFCGKVWVKRPKLLPSQATHMGIISMNPISFTLH